MSYNIHICPYNIYQSTFKIENKMNAGAWYVTTDNLELVYGALAKLDKNIR